MPSEDALKEDDVRFSRPMMTLVLLAAQLFVLFAAPAVSLADEPPAWRQEYDAVCGKTLEAEGMTEQELAQLLERCDKLRPQIESLGETERKVFLRRLQLCCELYRFVLDVKRAKR